ncbi:hypothetical protein H4N54_01730 [Limnospira fusiformis KN01]|uniref:hypothetical protein n=1 Tax=Limnospira TaxID=2596745 RepID=UPI001658A65E|nr:MULTISPECIES: hypothetical protein [Limnospira]MDT9197906.1 hypothetical protein [Limnospira sp. PMC 1042.18]MDT9235145.1 hypothetical protein [Limnospira sp. PMC 917.15]ULB46147.1 hypothetical protein H4N54_01730 [Limnospira fusiformis KN01]
MKETKCSWFFLILLIFASIDFVTTVWGVAKRFDNTLNVQIGVGLLTALGLIVFLWYSRQLVAEKSLISENVKLIKLITENEDISKWLNINYIKLGFFVISALVFAIFDFWTSAEGYQDILGVQENILAKTIESFVLPLCSVISTFLITFSGENEQPGKNEKDTEKQ